MPITLATDQDATTEVEFVAELRCAEAIKAIRDGYSVRLLKVIHTFLHVEDIDLIPNSLEGLGPVIACHVPTGGGYRVAFDLPVELLPDLEDALVADLDIELKEAEKFCIEFLASMET